MRFDGHGHDRTGREVEAEAPAPLPLDAAESTWDPWLRALYLRELEAEHRPAVH